NDGLNRPTPDGFRLRLSMAEDGQNSSSHRYEVSSRVMNLLQELQALLKELQTEKMQRLKRRVSVRDLLTDRWEIARQYGFGERGPCYDSVLVIGGVRVGKHSWSGPGVILDGSGGLEIGDVCSISGGVGIYTHHTVKWSTSLGEEPAERKPVTSGSGVYVG